ncbi:MAG: 16S rRNA (cytosine(967)-C(5))-methyltransferase RsmB [Lachnospiraceae bacterium]|nr:16S rRNA (cytosine(967)-C(5))-methyltransferase RsmB [Lachnospiraceae bacterium]
MLLEITEKESYSHLVMRDVLDKYDYLPGRDKAFLKRVTEGTLERRIQIDYILDQFSRVPAASMKPFIRNLLRLSVYQLFFMDSVPDAAVCNEAVKLAGKRGFRSLSGFVNGVLRNIARNRDRICWPDQEKEPVGFLSVKYSVPLWLVEKLLSERGRERTERILESFLVPAPVTIRIRQELGSPEREELISRMRQTGAAAEPHPYHPFAYTLRGAEGISSLPGFSEGLFMVQDTSSMLVCEAAGIRPGQRVIDVCASPGGKAVHAAEKLKESGFVSARDLTEYKAGLIRDNSRRMRADRVETLIWDARRLREEDIESADAVLADLPCSGLGVIGRKKDIKYRMSPESLLELAKLQRQILGTVWRYVKPGGVLIYSTCTINPGENEENVGWFLERYPFHLESLSSCLPQELSGEGESGMLQLLPGIHKSDGFFLARLVRDN